MPLIKITKAGLATIAFLVAVLWGCYFTERNLLRHAAMDTYKAMRVIRGLKLYRDFQPVSQPAPPKTPKELRPVVG
ncbi:MAG: hypothetical protein IPM24_10985 [Bryobacterales bacterium]|nr:hypothetical protein [Bryobacterales bacterium]